MDSIQRESTGCLRCINDSEDGGSGPLKCSYRAEADELYDDGLK